MPDWLPEVAAAAIAAILAITLHEAAHGYAALWLGDDTAQRAGRISINPLRHVDMMGTIILPGVMVAGQLLAMGQVQGVFGWAKPVPVNVWKLRSPRWGMVLVAAAGPATNAMLAFVSALLAHLVIWGQGDLGPEMTRFLLRFVGLSIMSNLVLGLFNLLPLPPLDGWRSTVSLLPYPLAVRFSQLERWGFPILLVLLFTGLLGDIMRPFVVALKRLIVLLIS